VGGVDVSVSFTPVLVPMSRGILATSTAKLAAGVTAAQVRDAWEAAYADEPFVHVLPAGEFPRTADTLGANTVLMGLAVDEAAGRVVVVSALDNLVKGTAGAAIQSANIALGFAETTGLAVDGVAP
jgi:N-acetyl-gamma-glutamyl-phosphate reductase